MIQIALNGSRKEAFVPKSTEEIIKSAESAVNLGADCVHFHPRDHQGKETLKGLFVDEQINAIRKKLGQTPVGITTGAWIEPNLEERLAQIASWEMLPDFVSVNYDEDGFEKITQLVNEKGIQIEAGLSNPEAAKNFIKMFPNGSFVRILIEPQEQTLAASLDTVKAIENLILEAGIELPILLHGEDQTCWDLVKIAFSKNYQTRIGFEDVLVLPDGRYARSNSELLAQAILIKKG